MSINQYSSDMNPNTPWTRQQQQQQQSRLMEPLIQNASSCVVNRDFNLNNQEDEELEEEEEEKEAMFEKALTPSDVGKLNRLVIPKQQAEKHFPLDDSGDNKGVVLSFEDESCKCWRFRYSYWNSSQSYVLTKGWSRYVKDKRLLAGDVVSFLRLRSRLFISFTRRHPKAVGWTTTPFYSASAHQPFPFSPPPPPGRGRQSEKQSCNKVLRLFGVNMECQTQTETEEEELPTHHMTSSSTYHYHHLHPSYAHHHMDVNQMRNRPG